MTEELLSDIPRLVHFARKTLRDMARPSLDRRSREWHPPPHRRATSRRVVYEKATS